MTISVSEELALQAAIKREMDSIILAATETVCLLKSEGKKPLEKNQIRNVLNVAEESRSVQVVANFIRYQIGRSGTGRGWQHNGFGLRVVEDILDVEGPVKKSLEAIKDNWNKKIPPSAELWQQAEVQLTRYYLGYLNRAFTYAISKTDDTWATLAKAVTSAHAPVTSNVEQGTVT